MAPALPPESVDPGAGCFVIGPAVAAYYLASFTVDAHGYYYRDTELGIAAGVFLIALGAVVFWLLLTFLTPVITNKEKS